MLMVESKQSRGRLAAASPSPTPSAGTGRASSSSELKSSEEWHEMHPSQSARINVLDLKAQIVKRVGHERANKYFAHFRSFISCRLSKQELDKLVFLTIGKENVALHNQLVRGILSNAVRAQVPPPLPPPPPQDLSKPSKGVRRKPLSTIPSDETPPQASPSSLSNGDSVLSSPRRGRSYSLRDRIDRPSPLGPREENSTPDLTRPLQQFEGAAKQPEAETSSVLVPPAKRLRVLHPTSAESISAAESCTPGIEENFTVKEDHRDEISSLAGPFIRAPLGAPFCSGSTAATRQPALHAFPAYLLLQEVPEVGFVNVTDLPDAEATHRRMEEVAIAEGLEGVRRDCADVLNHALDSFLSRLIKACVDAVGSRRASDQERPGLGGGSISDKNVKTGNTPSLKIPQGINGVLPAAADISCKDQEKSQPSISLTDFKMAMDLNPQQLGEGWPVQLEKISFRLFDQ